MKKKKNNSRHTKQTYAQRCGPQGAAKISKGGLYFSGEKFATNLKLNIDQSIVACGYKAAIQANSSISRFSWVTAQAQT